MWRQVKIYLYHGVARSQLKTESIISHNFKSKPLIICFRNEEKEGGLVLNQCQYQVCLFKLLGIHFLVLVQTFLRSAIKISSSHLCLIFSLCVA